MFPKKKKETAKITRQENPTKKFHFEKLAPIDDANIDVYEEAINFVFENGDIRNVAISGAYGSGKSSVLASYKKKYEGRKFIHISLAHFEPDNKEEYASKQASAEEIEVPDGEEKKQKPKQLKEHIPPSESVLEGKILNQLIHQLKEKNIPQTNFRVKKTLTNWQIALNSIAIIALLITVIHLVLSYTWINFVDSFGVGCWVRNILELTTTPASFFISGCIGLGIIVYYTISSVKRQRFKAAIRKLSLQGNDIELFENDNDSFFDKYLNEVLYLFENAGVDAIVFEDMDRYDMEGIFERLHEVNTLANIRLSCKGKQIVRFFFLLRDDLFVSKDRTKFFDYIIPVVPVLDSSNSYDQLIGHMKQNNLHETFKERFLQGLSLYIDDMRLLKNICNEFLIYSNRLKNTELDNNKMLAIITYKNIFPRDFSLLQINQGFVYALFDNKNKFIQTEKARMQADLEMINKDLETINNENLHSLREVDAAFADRVRKGHSITHKTDNTEFTNYVSTLLSGGNAKEWEERKRLLNLKKEGKVSEIEQKRQALQQRIEELERKKLSEIITRENIDTVFSLRTKNALDEVFSYEDVKRSQYFNLLKFLIRNGYIDESYADYMTYFYPNSITTADKVFLQSIANKVAKEYAFELKKPELVLKKLNSYDFDEPETLNFSLLTYMLTHTSAKECLQCLIAQLCKKEKFDFISQYLNVTPVRAKFVACINSLWPEFFRVALEKRALPEQQIWEYSHDTLYYSSDEDIKRVNDGNCLERYISAQPDYLNILSGNHDALIKGILLLGVKFEAIDYAKADHSLFMKVYEHSCYVLNYDNIALMLTKVFGIENETDIRHKNYWAITSKPNDALSTYIEQEIEKYVGVMLEFCDESIQDPSSSALKFLNHPGISSEKKCQYISKLRTEIKMLKDVENSELWPDLLSAGIIAFSENNLMDYWLNAKKFDLPLIDFINESKQRVDLSTVQQRYEDSVRKELFEQIVECKDLSNAKYVDMLTSIKLCYKNGFGITGVPDDKMELLIDADIIYMNPESLKFIRINYPKVCYQFIRKNLEDYISIMTAKLLVHDELLEILSWEVEDDLKITLLKLSSSPISVVNKGYSTTVTLYILQNCLEAKDMQTLCVEYSKLAEVIQQFVVSYAEQKIDSIITDGLKSSDDLKLKMLSSSKVSEGNKYKLLFKMLDRVSKPWAKVCFEHMKLVEFVKVFDSHAKPKIPKNDQNKKVLDVLVSREWIYDYPDYPYDSRYYTVRRNAPSKKRELIKV